MPLKIAHADQEACTRRAARRCLAETRNSLPGAQAPLAAQCARLHVEADRGGTPLQWTSSAVLGVSTRLAALGAIGGTKGLRENLATSHGDPKPMVTRTRRTAAASGCANPEPHRAQLDLSSKSLAACEDAALGSAAIRRSAEAADRVGVQCVERPICCRFDSPSLRTRQPYLSPAATTYTVLQLHPVVSSRGSQIDWMYNFPVRGGGASAHARRHPAHATGPGTQAPPWPCLVASCCINQAPPRK